MARRLVLRRARVAELEEHLAPQDPPRVHVRHRDHVVYAPNPNKHERDNTEGSTSNTKHKTQNTTRTVVFWAAEEVHAVLALHERRHAVAEEPGLWPELADDGHLVRGRDVVERGYRWMVRHCVGDVVSKYFGDETPRTLARRASPHKHKTKKKLLCSAREYGVTRRRSVPISLPKRDGDEDEG